MSVEERAPAYQTLADTLRAQITSGRLAPGDRLPTEPQLCQNSGVSRSTVREALRLLASQHLIVTTRGVSGGSFVAHPSPLQLSETLATGVRLLHATSVVASKELLEVREFLEVPAAGLAALRRDEEHLAAMRDALFDPDTTPPEKMWEMHALLHEAVAAACGNPLLELISRPLLSLVNAPAIVEQVSLQAWKIVDADHRAMYAAIAAGDAPAAEEAARQHMANLRRIGEETDL